jgi:hypothetical protein
LTALREALDSLSIEGLDSDLLDFLLYYVYSRGGEDLASLRYQVLFDLLDSPPKSADPSRKRPESSSPAQLKARNKEKYSLEGAGSAQKESPSAPEDEEEYKEEQFEEMLDKDDEEENAVEMSSSAEKKGNGEYIDEDKMLDIAEKCFMRIAEAIVATGTNVRDAFRKHISAGQTGEEYISP